MKRKLFFVLLTFIMVVSCAIGLVACGGNNEKGGSSVNGTYYLYENEALDKTQYITLNNGNWTDDDDENGTYTLNGSAIIFYAEILGSKEELYSGTIKDGVLTLNIMGADVVYCKDSPSKPTDPDKPIEKTLNFKLSGDNSYYIVTGIGGLSGAITVPETYQNKPVQQIADNAFAGEISLTEITLPQSITAIGANAFADCSNLASAELSEGLTVIPESAFSGCGKLTKITIPSSVSKIEKDAFLDCELLTDVHFLGTVDDWCEIEFSYSLIGNVLNNSDSNPLKSAENLFINGEIVTEITINSDKGVSPTAFINYNKLENVTIDMGGSIGQYAFYRCENLETLNLNSATTIDDYAFFRCAKLAEVNIPDTTTKIGYAAFGYCTSLKSLTAGDGIIEIGDYAFENCTALQSATLGNAVTDIGDLAFTSCQNLNELTFGNSLSTIGEMAFYMCDNLREVTFPASLMYIGEQAFGYLTSAVFENSAGWTIGNKNNTELSEETLKNPQEAAKLLTTSILHGGYYENYWERKTLVFTLSSDGTYYSVKNNGTKTLANVIIPSEYKGKPVTQIQANAFKDCVSMCSLTIPDSITKIGDKAFSGCNSIEVATIPAFAIRYIPQNNLKTIIITSGNSIETKAFYDCTSLVSITIPDSVTRVRYL